MEFVNGKDDIPYMKWKMNMFETTNLYLYLLLYLHCIHTLDGDILFFRYTDGIPLWNHQAKSECHTTNPIQWCPMKSHHIPQKSH